MTFYGRRQKRLNPAIKNKEQSHSVKNYATQNTIITTSWKPGGIPGNLQVYQQECRILGSLINSAVGLGIFENLKTTPHGSVAYEFYYKS